MLESGGCGGEEHIAERGQKRSGRQLLSSTGVGGVTCERLCRGGVEEVVEGCASLSEGREVVVAGGAACERLCRGETIGAVRRCCGVRKGKVNHAEHEAT